MRRVWPLFLFIALIAAYYWQPEYTPLKAEERETIVITHESLQVDQEIMTTMASPQKNSPAIEKKDLSVFKTIKSTGLPRGMQILSEVRMIQEDSYREDMGEQILKKNGQIYFQSTAWADDYRPAVYDYRRDTFHPLASTIKIEGVTEDLKEELSKAYEIYYYNPNLGILHISTSSERLFADFQQFQTSGLSAQLEVMDFRHQPK